MSKMQSADTEDHFVQWGSEMLGGKEVIYMCEKLGGRSAKDPGNDFLRFMRFLGMTCTGFLWQEP